MICSIVLLLLLVILWLVMKKENFSELKYNSEYLFAYRKPRISQSTFDKELNRDFNYEESLSYITPFQKLDYQDLLIL